MTPIGSATQEQPRTLPVLLRKLGVEHCAVEKQKVALRAWLAKNPPRLPLRLSLRSNGYGLLLAEDSVAKDPSDPVTPRPRPKIRHRG
jgi:hypothetical protein